MSEVAQQPAEGAFVFLEFDEGVSAGVVIRQDIRHLEVVLPDGPRRVRADRVFRVGSGHADVEQDVQTLASLAGDYLRQAETFAASLDLELLWELQVDSTAPATTTELAEILAPEAPQNAADALVLAHRSRPLYFRNRADEWTPRTREAVAALLKEREVALEREALHAASVAALVDALAGDASALSREAGARALALLEATAMHGTDHATSGEALELLAAVLPREGGGWKHAAFRILVELGHWDEHEVLDLHRHGLSQRFSEECLGEARLLVGALDAEEDVDSRVDLRDRRAVAIDDEGTTDVDDALWARRLPGGAIEFTVFIADVAGIIPEGGIVDQEGLERGSSLYLPEGSIPMLPTELGEGVASLLPGAPRRALAFSSVLDGDGILGEVTIQEAWCEVEAALSYDEVDPVLDEGADHPHRELLDTLAEATMWLRARRSEAGALMIRQTEWRVSRSEANDIQVRRIDATSARELVAEFMITACGLVGDYCVRENIPALFRCQSPPDHPIELEDPETDDPLIRYRVLGQLSRATLSCTAAPHSTLGVEAYTQVTSPIRRYGDLLMHRQLRRHLRGEPLMEEGDLLEMGERVGPRGGLLRRIERDTRRYWILYDLAKRVGSRIDGIVLRAVGRRWLVTFPALGIHDLFNLGGKRKPGDPVSLEVVAADPRKNVLNLRP
jgi:exoribonuclease-2